jgi:twinkle protein
MLKDENGHFIVPNLYSISGSAHFFNAADIGITVYRRPGNDFDMTEIHIQKVRFKWVGKHGMVEFKWNKETGTYREFNENNNPNIDFTTGDVTGGF